MKLTYQKIHPDAQAPKFSHHADACFDLCATERAVIPPGGSATFGTGLKFQVPPGFELKVFSRSGHGFNYGVALANSVGVIDSGYTGELRVCLRNDSNVPVQMFKGDRIAQAQLKALLTYDLEEGVVEQTSERGAAGLGSTGR